MLNLRKIVWHSCSSVTMVVAGASRASPSISSFLPSELWRQLFDFLAPLHPVFRVPAAVCVAKDRRNPNGKGSGTAWKSALLDTLLMLFLAALAALWIGLCPMRAMDHFSQAIGPTTLYELFMGLLLVPLLVIALCAAARLFLMLIMLATNSYPFQPKEEIDWCVTGLFLSFSVGIVLVLAQMHRNPLLSRITNKNSKSLGLDFYLRVAGFGAVPLITWLATQYPSMGGALYGLLKAGLEVMK